MKTGRNIYRFYLDNRAPIYSLASSYENAMIAVKKQLQTEATNRQKVKIYGDDIGPDPEIKAINLVTTQFNIAEGD